MRCPVIAYPDSSSCETTFQEKKFNIQICEHLIKSRKNPGETQEMDAITTGVPVHLPPNFTLLTACEVKGQ